ncbi:hypothetical protein C8F04DRAFT_1182853 [Mycena alexandri]|uniref:Uncharacterized protein n=1 Tax=Mycena alexandri TaxID=1745969 RepID=A0AAD6X4Q6_9AGAR|nr:hypothetical protein C8F04DRAFT_1182853 [Mycena alexandri]
MLQRENVDEGASQDELTGPANAPDDDAMAIYSEDADLGVPSFDPIALSAPSPPPPRSESPAPSSTRRSTRKRGASTTHDDAPAPKSKKTEATVAPETSTSVKKRGKRKTKPWSVRHTDDKIYTSFEFLAKFPEEYRELYGDTPPAFSFPLNSIEVKIESPGLVYTFCPWNLRGVRDMSNNRSVQPHNLITSSETHTEFEVYTEFEPVALQQTHCGHVATHMQLSLRQCELEFFSPYKRVAEFDPWAEHGAFPPAMPNLNIFT